MKLKKVFLVLERKALKMLSYVNDELYKELYPRYLRKIGINIPEDYREGKSGYIDPSAYFDGSDYRLISIGKNTTISRDVVVLTHDFSIVKGLQAIGQEATGHFLKPVKIGENCFIGARCLILPGTEIGDNTICGGAVLHGKIPSNSIVAGNPAKRICSIEEWTEKHMEKQDYILE